MTRSSNSMNQTHGIDFSTSHWAWLQGRLQRTSVIEATQELDEWLGQQLDELELEYSSLVTDSSRKVAAGLLVKASR